MKAVVTTGIGGYERLEYRDVPRPIPTSGEVLLQVLAAGINNTEINTRVGWYASQITEGTGLAALAAEEGTPESVASGWSGATPFPLIQGTDCCGRVVTVAKAGENYAALGSRVLVRPCVRPPGASSTTSMWMGCDFDGAFAQFVKLPASEVFPVQCTWTDSELASIPCAYGTAENLILRAQLAAGEHVLVSGASGSVGTALVQLARRRGAQVTAIAAQSKLSALSSIGADRVIDRDADIVASLGERSFDLVIDIVGGPVFPELLRVLRRGGRYASSGAIAGPLVALDLRTLYLKDLTLIGCTAWDLSVFPNLIKYIERGEIRPIIAKSFPLAQIADAQREFLDKRHFGKLILVPPADLERNAV